MSATSITILLVVIAAIIVDLILVRRLARRNRDRKTTPEDVYIFGVHSPALTWMKVKFQSNWQNGFRSLRPEINWRSLWNVSRTKLASRTTLWVGVEIAIIVVWTLIITKPYLNLDPMLIPSGAEYPSVIQTHHLWTRIQECGLCALWDGSTRGGAPAFVDPQGSMLHPLVIITTLIWGVLNGSKMALAGAFMVSGFAQWWLGRVLGLGRASRVWCALMAVAGGHLSVRMNLGLFGVVFSTACCALILPPLILMMQSGSRKATVLFGISLSQALLAGQGYIQVGLLFALPAAIILAPDFEKLIQRGRQILLAGLIAFMLAAPFLLPFLHFIPNFSKDLDTGFGSAQPLEYVPLNLVIRDTKFFQSNPVLHGNYIGWTAVVLAMIAVIRNRSSSERRVINFLFIFTTMTLWIASAQPLKWLVQHLSSQKIIDMLAGIRHPSMIAGLAIPALLGLAGIGLDKIIRAQWPRLQFAIVAWRPNSQKITFGIKWLLLAPMLMALHNVQDFGKLWISTRIQNPAIFDVIHAVRTPDLQWVNPPFGDHNFIEPSVGLGLKMSYGFRAWNWRERTSPKPVLEANYIGAPPDMNLFDIVEDVNIYKAPPGREYAQVHYSDETKPTVCQASGVGGDIEVTCETNQAGTLVVFENRWSGWRAEIDGQTTRLLPGKWLSVALPASSHRITFQYRPWDVPLGIGLSLLGAVLCAFLLMARESPQTQTSQNTEFPADSEKDPIQQEEIEDENLDNRTQQPQPG